jgi:hypothetical protein
LCIIQDSESDWLKESAMMASVYGGSYLNIGAVTSDNSTGGLFYSRKPQTLGPCVVDPDETVESHHPYFLTENEPMRALNLAELGRRAWVLQEQLLAPRTVYFAPSMLFWECPQICASETYPFGIHHRHFGCVRHMECQHDGHIDMISRSRHINGRYLDPEIDWYTYITAFSARKITYQTDKLLAISAIVRLAMTRWGFKENDYVAGLWKETLARSLVWKPLSPGGLSDQYVALSWSWASFNGPIHFDNHDEPENPTLTVLEATTVPKADPLGQVVGGHIKVRGQIGKVHFRIEESTPCYPSGLIKPNVQELEETPVVRFGIRLDYMGASV